MGWVGDAFVWVLGQKCQNCATRFEKFTIEKVVLQLIQMIQLGSKGQSLSLAYPLRIPC